MRSGNRRTRGHLKKRGARGTRRLLRRGRLSRQQKQRGGADTVTSLGAWIAAVQKSPSWASVDTAAPLRDLAEDVPIMPAVRRQEHNGSVYTERDEAFEVPGLAMNPADIRRLAPTVEGVLRRLGVTPDVSHEVFAQTILSAGAADPDTALGIQTLVEIENAIRTSTDMSPITTLSDSTSYPLFLWYMYIGATPGLVAQEANGLRVQTPEGLVPILSTATQGVPAVPGE
jgi:hypothetical protein